jgi:hypothetical protein
MSRPYRPTLHGLSRAPSKLQGILARLDGVSLGRLASKAGLSSKTLQAISQGVRRPSPSTRDALFDAIIALGGGVTVADYSSGKQRIIMQAVPELEQMRPKMPEGWCGERRPHEAHYDARFDTFDRQKGMPWPQLVKSGEIAPGTRVVVFPRSVTVGRHIRWVYRVIELKPAQSGKMQAAFPHEFILTNRKGEIVLAQQVGFVPRAGKMRPLRVVPAWPWASRDDERGWFSDWSSQEWEPFETTLGDVEPLAGGSLVPLESDESTTEA